MSDQWHEGEELVLDVGLSRQELRLNALSLAIRLMGDRTVEFPGVEHEPLMLDYEQIAIGTAERFLEWIER